MPVKKSTLPTTPVEPIQLEALPAPTPPASSAIVPQSAARGADTPGLVTAIAILTLLSGLINIMWGLNIAFGLAISIVLLCIAPLGLLPVVLGVFEILYAIKLLSSPPRKVPANQTIAILEVCSILFFNILSCIAGVLVLIFYTDPSVRTYFAGINAEG
jgi:hypothetical protein